MAKFINLEGLQYGWWTVIERIPSDNVAAKWNCRCECGKERAVAASSLLHNRSKSCGCKKSEMCRKANLKHGLSGSYIEQTRMNMVRRCYDTNDSRYEHYGGRGIRVCEWLRNSTPNLLQLLGPRPTPKHSINRIDNNGHYSCGRCSECFKCAWPMNVEWATSKQQARNKTTSRLITIDGITKTAVEWQEELGISRPAFEWRYMSDKREYFRKVHDAAYWKEWRRKKKEKVEIAINASK